MKFITYGAYVWLPVLTAVIWFAMLVGLLLFWLVSSHGKKYRDDEASILFISDIGAAHKGWFSPGCTLVFIFYAMTLLAERWLRHHQRIPQAISKRQRYWGYSTAIHGILGGLSLMMLSFLDTFNHPTAHWCFTFAFMIFIAISSFSQIIEVLFLHKEFPDRAHLRRNAALKFSIVSISTALGVVFGCLYMTCRGKPTAPRGNLLLSASAICEWSVALLLTFYFLTFALDFWPAAKTSAKFKRQLDSRFKAGSRETSDEFEKKLNLEKFEGFTI
ncbi:hypothetical protein PCANC_16941 [Puccinia coronata f. sp. avenae]|uniref:CWH43-like N-terminal domain-containing protein n=1 Tax=Puccinia coronata f. sp. avenae TaxID=200324 RepID=A0A2N5SSY8_9BASI|nr:hypothetical protein PCASD_21144 [Puccinia coronata f. sp. avenae]PLW16365.1 hypothetical protein PCANC_20911 [Puccinia coronata f. sp. avenae]PLW43959.1 hypothetical protein PCASD_06511 [Puccinia coronata f. sp. avenae]PLW45301.1 hypothetical protein PCANC_16941 [Puccinia coronata f. sp. avenae]